MELKEQNLNEAENPQLNIGAVRRSCLNCKHAIKFNEHNNDGKCGNQNSEAFKRNENNRTLFGSICELHNYA